MERPLLAPPHITPAAQVYALDGATSTPRGQVHRRLCDAGHLGLFVGHTALHGHCAE